MALNVRHVANVVAGTSEIRRAPVPRALMRLRPREIVNDVRFVTVEVSDWRFRVEEIIDRAHCLPARRGLFLAGRVI